MVLVLVLWGGEGRGGEGRDVMGLMGFWLDALIDFGEGRRW